MPLRTRKLLKAINLRKRPGTFLRDTFFDDDVFHNTTDIEIHTSRAKRKKAPFVSPVKGGKVMSREGHTRNILSLPKIAPERITTIDDIESLRAGESEYSSISVEEKQDQIAADDMVFMDDAITRTEEWMVREILLNKEVTIKGDDFSRNIKFDENDTLALSGTELFSHQDCDPLALLKEQQRLVLKASGEKPRLFVMDSEAGDAFISNVKVKEAFDSKHIKLGSIEPTLVDNNITFIGKIVALGIEVYTYDEMFEDENGDDVAYLPKGTCILGNKNTGKMNYAAVKQLENKKWVSIPGRRVPKHIVNEEDEIEKLRLSARPLPVPMDTKSWRTMKVL